ncbi:DUF6232 family protein [Solwaraspora sp. WMMD1047]|uniref:DUF6232 family protein n=1 Tax=Solwaraspora sp. WMMD1047 TaxID=3016102 RepID=UPI0024166CE8|nr:DUF6232 family protein [Solwaraspora sp. WMMD1047]MDG4829827.1 DUF6232 family protein [Solwaraspora sp. WMMD1047]
MPRTYYHDGWIRITTSSVWVDGRRYGLDEINDVRRQRTAVLGRRVWVAVGILALATLLLAGRLITSIGWWTAGGGRYQSLLTPGRGRFALVAVAVVLVALLGVLGGALALHAVEDIRRHGRRLELWATIRGCRTLLLSTNDAVRFGQVCRSLARALDDRPT